VNLIAATFNSASAWLSGGGKDSSVAYTTDWTAAYTSQNIYPEVLHPHNVAIRVLDASIQFWVYDIHGFQRVRVANFTTFGFTPAYMGHFTEGNVDTASTNLVLDLIGRTALP
jgi:hypothetical protein